MNFISISKVDCDPLRAWEFKPQRQAGSQKSPALTQNKDSGGGGEDGMWRVVK